MKTFTRFAGWPLALELSFALLIRFTGRTTARIRLVPAVLAFGACLGGQAQPLEVNVVNSSYTASVGWWGIGSFFGDPDVSGSNSVVSASPTSIDYINQSPSILTGPNYTAVWGQANAGLFQSYAFSNTSQGQYNNSFCDVGAMSDILFSPLSAQTPTLNLQFTGYDNWYQSDCLVTLSDVTLDQTLWAYGWTAMGSAPYNFPYVNLYTSFYYSDSVTVSVPTTFEAGDTYELVIDTDANSNNDNGGAQVQLSGLAAVPEPCPAALAGLAAMLLMLRRVPGWSLARRILRPGQ
jgi:hypothetical protein